MSGSSFNSGIGFWGRPFTRTPVIPTGEAADEPIKRESGESCATTCLDANHSVPLRARYAARISPLGKPSAAVNLLTDPVVTGSDDGSTRFRPRPVPT